MGFQTALVILQGLLFVETFIGRQREDPEAAERALGLPQANLSAVFIFGPFFRVVLGLRYIAKKQNSLHERTKSR